MRPRIETVALGLIVLAVVPCLAFELVWLNGAGVGVADGTALAELHSTRMVVGRDPLGLERSDDLQQPRTRSLI